MRLRFWLTIAAGALTAACAAAGCTLDFDQFEPRGGSDEDCGATEKLCGGACVSRLDPAYGCGDGCAPCDVQNASAVCSGGACVVEACVEGFDDCDGDPTSGCETETGANAEHCGACNAACDPANAEGACQSGSCVVTGCDPGFDDCDGEAATGCEASVASDPAHCGDCGTACPSGPNANAVCAGGTCGVVCEPGFDDCDGDPTTGCETDVTADTTNCGSCGRACDPTHTTAVSCAGGECVPTCATGFDNCENPAAPLPDDGCESDLGVAVDHCGACGRACDGTNVASRSCAGGVCTSTCDIGYANCSQPPAGAGADDGCELDVREDDDNCGGCGNSCNDQGGANSLDCNIGPNGEQQLCGCGVAAECDTDGNGPAQGTCGGGRCSCNGTACAFGEACVYAAAAMVSQCSCNGGAACGPGTVCCDTPSGCVNLQTSPTSCGACGHACPPGFACAAASCVCNEDADCNAGGAAAFSCNAQGRCECGGAPCDPGERCQPDGQCG